jgi:hypothetical protein
VANLCDRQKDKMRPDPERVAELQQRGSELSAQLIELQTEARRLGSARLSFALRRRSSPTRCSGKAAYPNGLVWTF